MTPHLYRLTTSNATRFTVTFHMTFEAAAMGLSLLTLAATAEIVRRLAYTRLVPEDGRIALEILLDTSRGVGREFAPIKGFVPRMANWMFAELSRG
jgi:hypothetical protein